MENTQKTPQQPTPQEEIKLKGFTKEWHILESPQIIDRICQLRHQSVRSVTPQCKKSSFPQGITRPRKAGGGPRISSSRSSFRSIKTKMMADMKRINSEKQKLTLSEILIWKQEILTGFMNDFMGELGKQCREKAQILSYIWNTMFNLLQYIFEGLSQAGKEQEQHYLSTMLQNHKAYQQVIENLTNRISRKNDECMEQNAFITALVNNLRYKRKEVNKLTKNMTIFTAKLNQFKDCYLDLQQEHIELLCQSRDISQQNALNLINRKQEINLERRKEYKLKQSRKKARKTIISQIKYENEHEQQKVTTLREEVKTIFKQKYEEKKKLKTHVSFANDLFETALDDFSYRIDNTRVETETLLSFKNNVTYTDVATDMTDFERDIQEADTQTSYNDFLYEGMICTTGAQTVPLIIKAPIMEEVATQVDRGQLKNIALAKQKVIDRSYILRDYRQKYFKPTTAKSIKFQTQKSLVQFKDTNLSFEDSKEEKSLRRVQSIRETSWQCSVMVQTEQVKFKDDVEISNGHQEGQQDPELEVKLNMYFAALAEVKKKQSIMKSQSKSTRLLKRKVNVSSLHSASTQDLASTRPGLSRRSSKLSESRAVSANRQSRFQSTARSVKNQQLRKKRLDQSQAIRQTTYEQLTSAEVVEKEQEQKIKKNVKFWVKHALVADETVLKKQRLIKNLDKAEKLMFKGHSASAKVENYLQGKKVLSELAKLSQQLNQNKMAIEDANYRVDQNLIILRQQLRQMLSRRQRTRKLALSRKNNLFKIISMVYTYAYHLFFDHNQPLQSLLVPLFHYFKIGYGQIKKNDLYLRLLYFLSQVICHQDESPLFHSFVFMLGLNMEEQSETKITKEMTRLYLKLVQGLAMNFNFPLKAEQLYTVMGVLSPTITTVLENEGYDHAIRAHIVDKIQNKLSGLMEKAQSVQKQTGQSAPEDQIKLNIFQCCHMVLQELNRGTWVISQSYQQVYACLVTEKNYSVQQFCSYVLQNSYLEEHDFKAKKKVIEQLFTQPKADLNTICRIFLKAGVMDLGRLYYRAISRFKLKEDSLILSVQRRVPFILNYVRVNQASFKCECVLINEFSSQKDKSMNQEMARKKIMALAYLKIIENESQKLVKSVLGADLEWLVQSNLDI